MAPQDNRLEPPLPTTGSGSPDAAGCSRAICPGEPKVPERTPGGRIQRLELHLNPARASSCGAGLCPSACAASPAPAGSQTQLSDRGVQNPDTKTGGDYFNNDFPVVNPYGPFVDAETFKRVRTAERAPNVEFMAKVKRREIPPPTDALAYQLFPDENKGKWPYTSGNEKYNNPYVCSPEMEAITRPAMNRIVGYLKNKTTCMVAKPLVVNGWDAFVNPKRFEAEREHIFRRNVMPVAWSTDLKKPNDFRRFEVCGKSLLLTRDNEGTFRAFENCCRHRGMELVSKEDGMRTGNKRLFVCPYHAWSYGTNGELMNVPFGDEGFANCDAVDIENRNLIELPTREAGGVLLAIPSPAPGADTEKMLADALPPELEKELLIFGLDKHHRVAEQSMVVDGNWKLVLDGWGEQYHLASLHPTSAGQANVSNMTDFRPLGEHGVHTVAGFTTRIMAAGDVEESRWGEPSVLNHVTPFYSLMPNCPLIVSSQAIVASRICPGNRPDEAFCTFELLAPKYPETDSEKLVWKKFFKFILDLVALEDFSVIPISQKNFTANPHAEAVYGRNEVACQYWYNYFLRVLERAGEKFANEDSAVQGQHLPREGLVGTLGRDPTVEDFGS